MSFQGKIRFLTTFFLVVLLLVWVKLFYWQIIDGGKLSAQAESQHFQSLAIPARRGEIRFRDQSPLVANKDSFLLYADLRKMTADKKDLSEKLADILAPQIPLIASDSGVITPEDREKFFKSTKEDLQKKFFDLLTMQNVVWVNLSHFLSRETKAKVESLQVSGLEFIAEQQRDYPEASMAAQLLGFVGSDKNGNPRGYFGLEGYYERELSGRSGEVKLEVDAFGRPIAIGSETRREKQDGAVLVTTLDRGVQNFVESYLQKGIKTWQAKGGTAIVMDPNSGAIIAMASFPRYDPQNFFYYSTALYQNPAVANLFEPGSIFKPVVMASALNENAVTPEVRCTKCDGPRQIGNYLIHTFDDHYHPDSTMTDVLVNSDNTGMIFVGEKLGFTKFYAYLQKFGFGQKTGVDLEEEEGGSFRKVDDYYPIDKATMTFGQGIAINALQMVRAMAVIANGGTLVTPHLISQIRSNGEDINLNWLKKSNIISKSTAQTLSEMLVAVANNSPEHFPKDRIAELAAFKISAKSGTAQIAVGGQYAKTGTTASVIGFFPTQNPRFVVLVKLNEPEVRPWGSDTAGPIFFSITRDLLAYYNITP